MGEWETTEGDLQKREMNYIKPLNSSMGALHILSARFCFRL